MSDQDRPWTEEEKVWTCRLHTFVFDSGFNSRPLANKPNVQYALLTQILKSNNVPSVRLLAFIQSLQIPFPLEDMPLPKGTIFIFFCWNDCVFWA